MKKNKGSNSIEFALILPVLLILLVGIIEYGFYFNEKLQFQNLINETCGEDYYEEADYLFIDVYKLCGECTVDMWEEENFIFCSMERDYNQMFNLFNDNMFPKLIFVEAVKSKDDEEEDTADTAF